MPFFGSICRVRGTKTLSSVVLKLQCFQAGLGQEGNRESTVLILLLASSDLKLTGIFKNKTLSSFSFKHIAYMIVHLMTFYHSSINQQETLESFPSISLRNYNRGQRGHLQVGTGGCPYYLFAEHILLRFISLVLQLVEKLLVVLNPRFVYYLKMLIISSGLWALSSCHKIGKEKEKEKLAMVTIPSTLYYFQEPKKEPH